MPDLPIRVKDLLTLILEIQEGHTWLPFFRKIEIAHTFPGAWPNARLIHIEVGLFFFTLEFVAVMSLEDMLDECGAIVCLLTSPPDDVAHSANASDWLGAKVPGVRQGWFVFRIPIEWERVCLFPSSEERLRVQVEAKLVDLVPPVEPLMRTFYRSMAQRIFGIFAQVA